MEYFVNELGDKTPYWFKTKKGNWCIKHNDDFYQVGKSQYGVWWSKNNVFDKSIKFESVDDAKHEIFEAIAKALIREKNKQEQPVNQ